MSDSHGGAGRDAVTGLDRACAALSEGRPVAVPNPSPMTYGIVATDPRAVNVLKGRPAEQNVAVSLHDETEWRRVAPCLDLPSGTLARVVAMLSMRLSLLVPLRAGRAAPEWVEPAVHRGQLAMFNGWWAPAAPLWDGFARLYGSSANRSGQPPAPSAARAREMLGPDVPVVDGDALRDLSVAHSASSMIRVAPDGALHLHRHGAQDAASGLPPAAYLHGLSAMAID